ncbi:MAG: insulinase family protein [candidate division KSB1 bacterium]|nr:insulinase family protein [candidate division KSB1 bacterium]MDZ7275500.1 insulinase family protein [candidate division KSB1 bacterium]MDZ7286188.1 insulinase family protein [candidate division KSB1 bacterium]MDZ7296414.1 insulinase family protein [candidate division KSB1 bacterium]MDZ7308944.1 insulinase family protein [candidate division KSB1 bacterium]
MKRAWLAVLLLAAGTRAQQPALRVPCERFVLPNGLNVILHEDHTTPIVSVNVWYHVGSASEKPGRTGFAHLFEHLMFEGSKNVPEGAFDEWLEAAGGNNNGSTTPDRTNYFEVVPTSALELALFLESDRMGFLLEAMSPAKVDGQRDVVKNERRQSYENRPYGLAFPTLDENLYAPDHPYHWPTIGYMPDLSAASYEDVVEFFQKYYTPANASLVIAGDITPREVRALVEKWFSDVQGRAKAPPPTVPPARLLNEEKRLLMEDRVQLPRLYLAWLSPPLFAPGDAELDLVASILAGGKNSRLYRRLVYELQIAQDVTAFQNSGGLSSSFIIITTARSGHALAELEKVVQEEIDRLKAEAPQRREVERAVNQYEAGFLGSLELVSRKADMLNSYFMHTGNPDYFNEDLARYRALAPEDLSSAAMTWLRDDARVILSVVPVGKPGLGAGGRPVNAAADKSN